MTDVDAAADGLWDVVVIGAGPAGGMTALLAARAGLRTLVVDRAAFPRHKVCGCCMAPLGQRVLCEAGLGDLMGPPNSLRLSKLQARRAQRCCGIEVPAYRTISRSELDSGLLSAAEDAGAAAITGVHARIEPGLRGVLLRGRDRASRAAARAIVVADGIGGKSAADVPGLAWRIDPRSRVGIGGVVNQAPIGVRADAVTMSVDRAGYVGVAPLPDGAWAVAGAVSKRLIQTHGPSGALATVAASCGVGFGVLEARQLAGTAPLTRWRCGLEAGGRVFVVGDAGGYVEPFTGEGMSWALAGAAELTPLLRDVARGGYHAGTWTRRVRRRIGPRKRACRLVASALRSERVTAASFAASRAFPALGRACAELAVGPRVDRVGRLSAEPVT